MYCKSLKRNSLDCKSWQDVKELTICVSCKKLFEKLHTLICSHTLCDLCIKQNDIKKCPSCPDDLAANKLIPFKSVHFENLYLCRLAVIFRNREEALKGINKTNPYVICSNCYYIGCKDTMTKSKPCTDKTTQHNFYQIDLSKPPQCLLECTLKQVCKTHPKRDVIQYCFLCYKEQCEECFALHKNHNSVTMQCIKGKLLKYLETLEEDSDIQKNLDQKISELEQHRDVLHKLYKEEYASTASLYDHKIHSICQEKQIVLSKLMTFWLIIDRTVENYKSEICGLKMVTNNFYEYFAALIKKSSDKEILAYFIKERRRFVVHNVAETVKESIHVLQRESGIFLQVKHILKKINEQKQSTKSNSFMCTDLSATTHSRTGKAFKQEYQCLNYEDKLFKISQIQINIFEEEYSMFTLPLPSSKIVRTTKQEYMVVSKCAQCLNQLQLFSRVLGEKYSKLGQKQIVKSLNNYLLCSNQELLSVTIDAINGIKMAITHLQIKDVSSYCEGIKENLVKLKGYIKQSKDYFLELELFYLGQQKLHINYDDAAVGSSGVVYISMLLDIMMDCRTYISSTTQICEKLLNMEKIIEILQKEGQEKEYIHGTCTKKSDHLNSSDSFKKLIASNGFQLQIVMHYCSWVALNDLCQNTAEIITCWDLDKT